MADPDVTIVGGGLAGSEAAWQLATRGVRVRLCEMRPHYMTKAHRTGLLAELVCSNSLRGKSLSNAVGLLKEELRISGSLIMQAALVAQVPAGDALAVDRDVFSNFIDSRIRSHAKIEIHNEEVRTVPAASPEHPVIIATGPLTSKSLAAELQRLTGAEHLAFFDAISPIVYGDSIDMNRVYRASRYGKGGDDYLNVPLTKDEYYRFIEDIRNAEKYGGHEEVEADDVSSLRPFEGCMPIEEMVERGPETLRFGPLKPVGLTHPVTGEKPYAVLQLRQDDKAGRLWSMVGMQTRMKHPEQKRVFTSLPGLEQAEFIRLGSVHRNTFLDSPRCLDATFEFRNQPGLFFAGQITGTEGYVESTAGGLVAGINAWKRLTGQEPTPFPIETAMGALAAYISDRERKFFQPMNVSFGLMPSYAEESERLGKRSTKADRRASTSRRALERLAEFLQQLGVPSLPEEPVAAPAIDPQIA